MGLRWPGARSEQLARRETTSARIDQEIIEARSSQAREAGSHLVQAYFVREDTRLSKTCSSPWARPISCRGGEPRFRLRHGAADRYVTDRASPSRARV